MKTTFSRQFAMIAALLLLCLLITGVSFRFLMLGSIESQNQQTMIRDAEAVAELAEAYDSVGDLQNNFDFHISLSLFTKVGDAEALLCDTDGVIRICSCEKFSCDHIGQTVDPVLLAEIQKDGSWYEETSLSARSFFEVEHSKEVEALEQAARRRRLLARTRTYPHTDD